MKEWYEEAGSSLITKLEEQKKVDGFTFLQDFVLDNDNRSRFFADLEYDDVDTFVSGEFDEFQKWLCDNPEQTISAKNGKWSLYVKESESMDNQESSEEFSLTDYENELLELEPYRLDGVLTQKYKELFNKLRSTNFSSDKYKCAFRLAKRAEIDRDVNENERIELWLQASDMALEASLLKKASDCKKIAAVHCTRINNHNEAAQYFEDAYSLIESDESIESRELLRLSRIQYQLVGDHDNASRIFICEKNLERKTGGAKKQAALWLYWLTSNYGESPKRVIFNAVIILIFSTVVSFFLGVNKTESNNVQIKEQSSELTMGLAFDQILSYSSMLADSAYYSLVTFTTLGYGDMYPNSFPGKLLAVFVAVLGLLYSSLFMVALVRKYSRS